MQAVDERSSLNSDSTSQSWWSGFKKKWFGPKHERLIDVEAINLDNPVPLVEAKQESKLWNLWYGARWVLPGGMGWKVGWAALMAILIPGAPAFLGKFWGGLLESTTERYAIGLAMAIPVPVFALIFIYNNNFMQHFSNLRDDSAKLDYIYKNLIEYLRNLEKQNNAAAMYNVYERLRLVHAHNNADYTFEAHSELLYPEDFGSKHNEFTLQQRVQLVATLNYANDLKNEFRAPHPMLKEYRKIMQIMTRESDTFFAQFYENARAKFLYSLVAITEIAGGMVSQFGLPIFAMILNPNALVFDGIFFAESRFAPLIITGIVVGVIASIGGAKISAEDKINAYRACRNLIDRFAVALFEPTNQAKINANQVLLKKCRDAHEVDVNWVRFFNRNNNYAPREIVTAEPKNSLTIASYKAERKLQTVEQGDVFTGPVGSSVIASAGHRTSQAVRSYHEDPDALRLK